MTEIDIRSALDHCLADVYFTPRMQQEALRKVRMLKAERRRKRRQILLSFAGAAAAVLLIFTGLQRYEEYMANIGDPINPYPGAYQTGSTEATFLPLAQPETASPAPAASSTVSVSPTPTAEPTVSPTATPTPTPTATPSPMPIPTATPVPTEPAYDDALFKGRYEPAKTVESFSSRSATLRIYDQMAFFNLQFRCQELLPEGSILQLSSVDGVPGNYGSALIRTDDEEKRREHQALLCCDLVLFNNATVQAVAPDGSVLFEVEYECFDWSQPSVPVSTPTKKPAAQSGSVNNSSSSSNADDVFNVLFPTTTPFGWITDGMGLHTPAPGGFQAPSLPGVNGNGGWGW